MSTNKIQHGGTHYREKEYQHWDWVCDIGLPYLLGCATKYVSRWRKKGGELDLAKAIHYVEKAEERGVEPRPSWRGSSSVDFISQHGEEDARVLWFIMAGAYADAKLAIRNLPHDPA